MEKFFEKINYNKNADEYIKNGMDKLVSHDYDDSVFYLKRALEILKNDNCVDKYVKILNVLGLVYTLNGNNKEALDCYLESLATAEVIRSSNLKAMSFSNIASCYQKMGIHHKALEYFREARREYAIASKLNNEDLEMWNLLNYINIVLSGEQQLFINDKYVATM